MQESFQEGRNSYIGLYMCWGCGEPSGFQNVEKERLLKAISEDERIMVLSKLKSIFCNSANDLESYENIDFGFNQRQTWTELHQKTGFTDGLNNQK